ncbi:hypothetical protein FTV88_2888 [Heliorestis convoluta]|uniref:Uncharacterized protein n=1 Tax=Heliorestis convoluta TaxID=356322 RepID=A0A5Q2N2C4_9FIRM|nr:hypothetical protein FTV88_2888 [Heliorestis convoluta]
MLNQCLEIELTGQIVEYMTGLAGFTKERLERTYLEFNSNADSTMDSLFEGSSQGLKNLKSL